MADSSGWEYGVPLINIVGENFCVPYTMEMYVKKRIQGLSNAHYDVYDISGNLLLQVDGNLWKLQKKRVMRDPAGIPLLTMRLKSFKWRKVWSVHAGETSEDNNNILFKVEQANPLQIKTKLEVFLPENNSSKPDFHVTGSFASLSFKVCRGKSVISQANHSYSWGSFCKGRESFKVRVHPEVDYSFIVALLVILEENET
ncbi:protein LURP-one-related 14 [Melia azedarach]|uniref:Protein LURP-one-related 14 n=1 Tax=Melia azedarach TaxID=155640 RepID=A0ACC1YA83_MELAZ|nr:protein LURP-one-related 14 [Melia azedarach]